MRRHLSDIAFLISLVCFVPLFMLLGPFYIFLFIPAVTLAAVILSVAFVTFLAIGFALRNSGK